MSSSPDRIRCHFACWWSAFGGSLVLSVLWFIGQYFRDISLASAWCFYIPSPVVSGLLCAWSVWHARGRRWTWLCLTAGLALCPLWLVLFVENRWFVSRPAEVGEALRLVHWNIGSHLGPAARTLLQDRRADIVVLSETPEGAALDEFQAELGDEYALFRHENLAALVRGRVVDSECRLDKRGVRVVVVDCEVRRQTLRLLIVDLPSAITFHRHPFLKYVNLTTLALTPDIVVGDFNTPRRSRRLSRLPAGYRHAFDTAGSGCGYTWPVPVPVYAIDQCIHAPHVRPVRYDLRSTLFSDHRLQEFDFRMATTPLAP